MMELEDRIAVPCRNNKIKEENENENIAVVRNKKRKGGR